MSKAIGLALAITETAKVSFYTTGKATLDREIWDKLLESSKFQDLVHLNIKPEKNWLGIPVVGSLPDINDFRALKQEYGRNLDLFMSWDSVRTKFLMLEADRAMAERVPEGFFSETIYDYVLEDCYDYLGERY